MYCHLCGADVPDGADACPECGVDLDADIGGKGSDSTASSRRERPEEGQAGTERTDATAGRSTDRSSTPETTSGPTDASGPSESGNADPERRRPVGGQQGAQSGSTAGDPVVSGAEQRENAEDDQPVGGQQGARAGSAGGDPVVSGAEQRENAEDDQPVGGQQGAQSGSTAGDPVVSGAEQREDAEDDQPPGSQSGDGRDGGDVSIPLSERLPILPGALAGAVAALAVFGLGSVLAIVIPPQDEITVLELGALVTMDLHFATPEHVTPWLFSEFQTADPPEASLGILYLLVPLILYEISKLVVDFGLEDRQIPFVDEALAGATIVLGYLPVAFVLALLASGVPSDEFSILVGIGLAGLGYPLAFGLIGGLSAAYFTPEHRRVGTLYGIAGIVSIYLALFVTSALYLGDIELSLFERLLVTAGALTQTHSLTFVGVADVIPFVPIALTLIIVGAMGFVRVWRSRDIHSPMEGATRAITPAVTYTFLVGVLASGAVLLADPWLQRELELGFATGLFADALAIGPLQSIGTYVGFVIRTFLFFPVIIGGTAGVIAWWVRERERR